MNSEHSSPMDVFVSQLHNCAALGDVSGIVTALKVHPDVNVTNSRGWTALMFASRNGHKSAVKMLLDNGADVTAINSVGQTARDIAEFWLHDAVVAEMSSQSAASASPIPGPTARQTSNYFCNSPLDRAAELRSDTAWLSEAAVASNTVYVLFVRLDLVIQKGDGIEDPSFRPQRFSYHDIKSVLESHKPTVIFLGIERASGSDSPPTDRSAKRAWFAVDVNLTEDELHQLSPDSQLMSIHPRILKLVRTEASIVGHARSILAWHDRYRYCPTCGSATEVREAGYKRVCLREDCRSRKGVHNTCYPRTDPTVIAAILSPDKDHLLLGRNRRFPGLMYSCLAGFMEPGESIEEACRREVHEEAGIRVGHVEYHSCQPWPMPSSLMIGCIGFADSTAIKVDNHELADARWFSSQDVRLMLTGQHPKGYFCPPSQAIAHQLIKHSLTIMSKL